MKTKKVLSVFLILILVFIFSGCNCIDVPEEDLVIKWARNVCAYEYSEKVSVVFYQNGFDTLEIKYLPFSDEDDQTNNEDTYNSSDDIDGYEHYHTILEGEFSQAAYCDGLLFIEMDGTYYAFDIDNYKIIQLVFPFLKPKPEQYDLKEYSKSEFEELYPQYESFEWYGH